MGLSNAEVVRLRAELGYNAVQVANPYLTAFALFETVIATYVEDSGSTTSSTVVTATGGAPAVVTLTLGAIPSDNNGHSLQAGDRVWIDVDSLLEKATVRNLSGLTIDVMLALGHSGIYPVAVDGGVAMVREKLAYIRTLTDQIQSRAKAAGVKMADSDVEFHSPREMDRFLGPAGALWEQREWERRELADFIGVVYLRGVRESGGSAVTVF